MGKKRLNSRILLGVVLAAALVIGGCSQESKSGEETSTVVQTDSKEKGERKILYWRAPMDPTYISPEPGKSPMGMDLIPVYEEEEAASPATGENGERKILYWRAPMDPTYISPEPGKSPMGMDLIPVYEGEETFGPTVKINPVMQQNMGIRLAHVVRKDIYQTIRTIGRIDYDESKVAHVYTKITGWIENTYVNTTGQSVQKGDILLDIYSPQLVSAQEEYLDALRNLERAKESGSLAPIGNLESILASTKRRLEYFDISESQIEELARTGKVRKTLDIESPFDGIVVEKNALDGVEVKSGIRLYIIADLSEIWVYADIYEFETPWVKVGQTVRMTLSYDPGREYTGTVQYVYPYLEEKTRTIKVRLVFANPNLDLKPGMYTNVEIETSPLEGVIAVPMEAVLFSGERNLVFISLGQGRFAPRDVTIGIESGDGFYEVKAGLSEGEVVVTSGQFLLDSESRLQESIAKMLQIRTPDQASPMDMEMDMETDITPDHQEHEHNE